MKGLFTAVIFFFVFSVSTIAAPTFGDLAVLVAKDYFSQAVSPEASLEECVAFLNRHGIHFSMFDLLDPGVLVTKEDFARVIGQSHLVLLGEAEVEKGMVKRPNGIDSWVDYCLLNDVDLLKFWNRFLLETEKESVPEVQRFFNGSGRNASAENGKIEG